MQECNENGADYVVGLARLGAFAELDAGRYGTRDIEEDPRIPISDVEIENRTWHYFIGFGARVALVFPDVRPPTTRLKRD